MNVSIERVKNMANETVVHTKIIIGNSIIVAIKYQMILIDTSQLSFKDF